VNQALRAFFPQRTDPDYLQLGLAIERAALDGGKRLRPCLVVAACEAVGGSTEQAMAPACSVEMIHAYSLVHDDLPAMDDDDLRRGKPTCHKEFGEPAAILVGDALLTQAFEIMAAEGRQRADDAQAILQATFELARCAGAQGMVGGQAMDIVLKDDPPSFDVLENCHALKTAALFKASATMGGLVGGGTDEQVETLRQYGFELGLAFQHADDLRDADFPLFKERSLSRATELAAKAAAGARSFGDEGAPLVALAELVARRAQETT
jgi:geranylgeranyl diphosphate synthase type II